MVSLRDELQNIYDSRGELTPEIVVEEAKNSRHPLHHRFEWDDKVAGKKYRLVQAQELIRSVKVVYKNASGEEHSVRAFTSVRQAQDENKKAYQPTEEVLENEFTRQLILAECKREIASLTKKYGHLQEYADLLKAEAQAS